MRKDEEHSGNSPGIPAHHTPLVFEGFGSEALMQEAQFVQLILVLINSERSWR